MPFNPGSISSIVLFGGGGVAPGGAGANSAIQIYNAKTYGVPSNGTGATAALTTLITNIIAGQKATVYFPPGSYGIDANFTFPKTVQLWMAKGARFVGAAAGKTLTILGEFSAARELVFDQSVNTFAVDFRDPTALLFSTGIPIVSPEWFGAVPGDGGANPVDAGPGIQLMTRCGTRKNLFGEGPFTLKTQVTLNESPVNPNDTTLEGTARTGSYLLAGPAAGSFGAINAMFVNKQNNGKLSFRAIRFAGSGFGTPAYLGWVLWCQENGATSQAVFSGRIEDCWMGLGSSAAGGVFGGLNNFFVTNCVHEGMKVRYQLMGAGVADVHFTNNSDYACFDSFLDMSVDALEKNLISVIGLHSYQAQNGILLKANNCRDFILDDIEYQVSDPVAGAGLGLLDLLKCRDFNFTNVRAKRYPGHAANMTNVMKFDGCTGEMSDTIVDGGDIQISVQGRVDLLFTNCTFLNAASFILRFIGVTSGRIKFVGCRLQFAGIQLAQTLVAGCTYDIFFENCELLDAGYGAGAGNIGLGFETTGKVRITGGRLGTTTNIALAAAWAAATAYVEGDIRSDGGVNYLAVQDHVSSAAGAGGNEPGVGATWPNFWRKHVSNMTSLLGLTGTGTVQLEDVELTDPTIALRSGGSTQAISSLRLANVKRSVPVYGAAIAIDLRLGIEFDITANNAVAFTVNLPTNPFDGARITITIRNTSGGALGAVTWAAGYKLAAWASPATAFSRSIDFKYDGVNWVEVSRTPADVPN